MNGWEEGGVSCEPTHICLTCGYEQHDNGLCADCLQSKCVPLVVPPQYDGGNMGPASVRTFETGATRDTEDGKLDYEGFLDPFVLRRYAEYMHEHRLQKDGSMRDSDNWQRGMPLAVYMKSMIRHVFEVWRTHRLRLNNPVFASTDRQIAQKDLEDALCATMFNAMGYLRQQMRGGDPVVVSR